MLILYPGSFDPPTIGHMDIIERLSSIGDKVVVAILTNIQKKCKYSVEVRVNMFNRMTSHLSNVEVSTFSGLLSDYAAKIKADFVARGLRNEQDFTNEKNMAQANAALTGVETLFMCANPSYSMISSSMVREILSYKGDVSGFVPATIIDML